MYLPGLSVYKLAQEIHVPVSRVQNILHDRRRITADTSLRMAKCFGVSEQYGWDFYVFCYVINS
ncbi:MAG: helix-turn-helix domain-containing protein [Clostridiales bacterium]|nr:helix-turn-helix domain-containing protein [Clostridiales bacterium]